MDDQLRVFEILEVGNLTVVGFGIDGVPNHLYHPECLQELVDLVEETQCRVLGIDMQGVPCIASGFIGLLASLQKRGIEIRLYNPMEHVQQALETMRLDSMFQIEVAPSRDWQTAVV